jgi:hypothetical protein
MGSLSWSARLDDADSIAGGNIADVAPDQGSATAANLDPKVGTTSALVVLTEFRGDAGTTSGCGYIWTRDHRSAGWVDNFWAPAMFDKNWDALSGEYFIRDWLACALTLLRPPGPVRHGSTYDASSVDVRRLLGRGEGRRRSCTDTGRWMSAVGDAVSVFRSI